MGISDDISRKKTRSTHHIQNKNVGDIFSDHIEEKKDEVKPPEKTETKVVINKSAETDFFDKEKSHDDFFPLSDKKKATKPAKKEALIADPVRKSLNKKIWRTVRFYLVMIAVVLVVIANQAALQKYFIGLFSSNKSTSTEDSSVKIVPQDYTTQTTTTTTPTASTAPAVTTPTTPPATTAPVVATPTYVKSALKIEILNGNGIKKDGATTKTLLTNAGFTVTKTANAANFNYTTTYIYYKTGNVVAATDVKSALTTKDGTLANDDKICGIYDIVIILGSK